MNTFVKHELGVISAREDSWLCINVAAACSGNGNGRYVSNKGTGLFCGRVMGVPVTSANGAFVKEFGKEAMLGREMKYWLRLLEVDETDPIGEAKKRKDRSE